MPSLDCIEWRSNNSAHGVSRTVLNAALVDKKGMRAWRLHERAISKYNGKAIVHVTDACCMPLALANSIVCRYPYQLNDFGQVLARIEAKSEKSLRYDNPLINMLMVITLIAVLGAIVALLFKAGANGYISFDSLKGVVSGGK